MDKSSDYSVYPDTNPRVIKEEVSQKWSWNVKAFFGYFCLSFVLILFALHFFESHFPDQFKLVNEYKFDWLMENVFRNDEQVALAYVISAFLCVSGIVALALTGVTSGIKRRRKLTKIKSIKINQNVYEANEVTSRAIALLEASSSFVPLLPNMLKHSSEALKRARVEYKENAFGPFWDEVEEAAGCLADFNSGVQAVSQNAGHYYESLKGRNHNFSSFPVRPESLPDSSAVVEEFNHVVRMGQTNFQFANIWEHRKTREVLIAGFRTLGEAVNNLGTVIDNSISDFKSSFSSDIARLVDEQIRTRETIAEHASEQSQMLDNIQHRRKPL